MSGWPATVPSARAVRCTTTESRSPASESATPRRSPASGPETQRPAADTAIGPSARHPPIRRERRDRDYVPPARPERHGPPGFGDLPLEYPDEEDDIFGDAALHDRYEDIKRGEIHLTELQKMTMPQLIRTAKSEGITDYMGLKKQDLIFRILKERVKQNGLMYGEGTLEVLPDGFRLPAQP